MAKADSPAGRPKAASVRSSSATGSRFPSRIPPDAAEGWTWFPSNGGSDYALTKPLEPLAAHRSDLSIFGGMSHPSSRLLVGHNTVDVWLTGADIRFTLDNTISLDQLIARHSGRPHAHPTPWSFSSHGGVGTKSRSTTISFDAQGRQVPRRVGPGRLFRTRLFEPPRTATGPLTGEGGAGLRDAGRVDFLLEDSRSLRNNLGRPDQRRLDEFLESLSEVETRLYAPMTG